MQFQVKQYRAGKSRFFARYKATLLVLRTGCLAIYTFKNTTKKDDRLIENVDLAGAELFLATSRLKLIAGECEYMCKTTKHNHTLWVHRFNEHLKYRQVCTFFVIYLVQSAFNE